MNAPFPSSVISILRSALRVVEHSGFLPENSAALAKLREAIGAAVTEIEPLAKLEPGSEILGAKTGADLYKSR